MADDRDPGSRMIERLARLAGATCLAAGESRWIAGALSALQTYGNSVLGSILLAEDAPAIDRRGRPGRDR